MDKQTEIVKLAHSIVNKSELNKLDKSMVMIMSRIELIEQYLSSDNFHAFCDERYIFILSNLINDMEKIRHLEKE